MKIVSYNIHKGIGGRDRRYRLERIAEVLAREEPDIVCLQEVDSHVRRSRFEDQARKLAEAFPGFHRRYQKNVRIGFGGYGNLVLSRYEVAAYHSLTISLGRRIARGAQFVHLDTPGGRLLVLHWHLGLGEAERHWQVRRVLEHAWLPKVAEEKPIVVIGDSNDWRNTLARGPFAEHGFAHVTAPPSRFRSFPAYFPLGSLDKAYVRGPLQVDRAHIAHSRVARDASDHLPLVVELSLARPPASGSRHD